MIVVIIVGVVLTIGIIVSGVIMSRRGDTATRERLGQFVGGSTDKGDEEDEERKGKAGGPSLLTQNLDQAIEERGLGKNLATELPADMKLTVADFGL
jgi:regulator of protease activity HflC (stomatin/prohibitin superfamily)